MHASPLHIIAPNGATIHRSEPLPAVSVWRDRLVRELNPVAITEQLLVAEISRCADQVRRLEAVRNSLQQLGAAALQEVVTPQPGSEASAVAEIGVLTSPKYVGLLQQEDTAARGLLRALHAFHALRRDAPSNWQGILQMDPRFASEPACLTYLVRRYQHGLAACRRCDASGVGCAIVVRRVWQCGRCQTQTGLRRGTCFEHSSVPLGQWFAAIRAVLLSPAVPIAELAAFLRLPRLQTVRGMIQRIDAAIQSPAPSQQLAGLDEIYLPTH